MMAFTLALGAATQPATAPNRLGVFRATKTGPASLDVPLWMCDAVGGPIPWTVTASHTWPWFFRSLRVIVPVPSGSAGAGTSVTPTIMAPSPTPPVVAVRSVLGHDVGAGTMSPGLAVYAVSA